jgi:hypothetical protein
MQNLQRPRGGCTNCGAPVRTRKSGQWLCGPCDRAESEV